MAQANKFRNGPYKSMKATVDDIHRLHNLSVDDEASASDILDRNLQGLATTDADADADPNLLERFADVSSQSSSARSTGTHEGASTSGLLNLEKELVCFICTEVLYQPLTLLDCLHTSCGSCLKEWFSYQYKKASNSRSSQTSNAYTCPICRANVRDARHNATVSRLLDMFLLANPEKARSTQEKEDMAKAYKPGEDILPKLEASRRHDRRARQTEEAAEETKRRMIEEARERSLREMRGWGQKHHSDGLTTPDTRHGSGRSRSRDSRDRDAERERRREQERQERTRRAEAGEAAQAREGGMTSTEARPGFDSASLPLPPTSRHPDAISARWSREIGHQASLRSPISASDNGTGTDDSLNEARIMQEILSEGLLDGIDLCDLDEAQEDELSERIAETYRRKHRMREQHSPRQISISTSSNPQISPTGATLGEPVPSVERHRWHRSGSSQTTTAEAAEGMHPLVSRPHLLEVSDNLQPRPGSTTHRQRSSDQQRRRTSLNSRSGRTASEHGSQRNEMTRSATDVSSRKPPPLPAEPTTTTHMSPRKDVLLPTRTRTQYTEPSVSCARCSRPNIQYALHYHCSRCVMDLCLPCYRAARGCNHWVGFGKAAQAKFEASHPYGKSSQLIQLPHILVGRKYLSPPRHSVIADTTQTTAGRGAVVTTSNPAARLQEGKFCDRCQSFANGCFWSCDYCNEGEWGFCNKCVNTHHCCTHPLLPMSHRGLAPKPLKSSRGGGYDPSMSTVTPTPSKLHANIVPATPYDRPLTPKPTTNDGAITEPAYLPLTFTTHCDICKDSISLSESRFHCPEHHSPHDPENRGDYDICTSCYFNLVKLGKIKREDGPAGWRKCPSGHRMIVVEFSGGFPQSDGYRRVVVNDLVGGHKFTAEDIVAFTAALSGPTAATPSMAPSAAGRWSWRESGEEKQSSQLRAMTLNAQASKFPPDGGFGKRCLALWSYYPEEGDGGKGDLLFPRGAEVREAEDINEEWSFGVYAGEKGLFPAQYVRVLDA